MLKILVEGVDPIPSDIVWDVDRAFHAVRLTGDAVEKELLRRIDEASYVDHRFFYG